MKQIVKHLTQTMAFTACLTTGLAPITSTYSTAEEITSPESTQSIQRVSLNTADTQTLAAMLDGIGQVKAERIVAWREANGRFERAEQLLEIKGIGEATLKKNLNRIAL